MSFGFGNPTVNLVFVHVVYGLGFTTLFFRNYYEAFPTELIKAAQVDGASFFQIFRRIMLPNSLPIFVVTVIYQFTNIWNDFLFASAYAGTGDAMPMTVALNNVVNTSTGVVEYNVNMAAAMIAALPDAARLCARRPLLRARPDGRRRQRMTTMAFLEIANLKKRFGTVEILKGIDIDLEKGGFLVLVGPSGCGKSTLLNTIAGLETITEGEIRARGPARSTTCTPRRRDIAMVFQSYALYPNMTVAGNISFGMEMRGVPKEEREKAIDERRQDAADRPSPAAPALASSPAASASASPWAGRWCATPSSSCSTSRCRTSTPSSGRHAHRDQAPACDDRHHHRLRHPRPDRGDDAGHQDRRAQGRRGAAGRHAGRDLQQAGQPLRRRLHGLAGDEPDQGQGGAGERPHRAQARQRRGRRRSRWRRRATIPAKPLAGRAARSSSASARRRSPTATAPTATPRPSR